MWRWSVAVIVFGASALFTEALLAPSAAASASVYRPLTAKDAWTVVEGKFDPSAAARATYEDALNKDGWLRLHLETNGHLPDIEQGYAAGFLEGWMTAPRIAQHWANLFDTQFPGANRTLPQPIADFLVENENYIESSYRSNPTDGYWVLAYAIYQQYRGTVDGYNAFRGSGRSGSAGLPSLDSISLSVVNANGDLGDLINALLPAAVGRNFLSMGRCSGLIRVSPDLGQLWTSHSTWYAYASLMHLYKSATLNFQNPFVQNRRVAQSSYPGSTSSTDDFYICGDQRIVVFETSNNIFDKSAYKQLTPRSLLAWHRAMLANYAAASAPEWTSAFAREHSGTYVSSWLAVDYKLFVPRQPLHADLAWLVEEIPGLAVQQPVSAFLSVGGFWPGFNIPFDQQIWKLSGYGEMLRKTNDTGFTFSFAPRAKIFRRDAGHVLADHDMQLLMRYNNFRVDPLSDANPGHAIMSRFDLASAASDRAPAGGMDTKIMKNEWFNVESGGFWFLARNGPTSDQQPPFDFTAYEQETGSRITREGLPTLWDMPWVQLSS